MEGIKVLMLATLALVLASIQQTDAAIGCNRVGNGFACEGDKLEGVLECSRGELTSRKQCSANQMCSCGRNRVCRNPNMVRCVDRPSFSSSAIPMNFIVFFNGIHFRSNPNFATRETSSGNIWQDTTPGDEKFKIKQSFRQFNNFTNKLRDVLRVIRRDGDNYVQYTQVKDFTVSPSVEYCNKQVLSKFEDFFYDLRLLSQQVPKQDPTDDDVFVYRDGPLDAGSGSTRKRWTMGPRHITQSYVPASLNIFRSTGQQGRTSERTNYNFGYYYLFKPDPAYFVIPYKCLN
ncbi:uncharacterized protein [Clytia hemisphaerica]|uniref:Uncharacterized protein n=1 Tax=Clytia hemisphaerica TaxID=252671 RepID=A0A7M5X5N6_9CNID